MDFSLTVHGLDSTERFAGLQLGVQMSKLMMPGSQDQTHLGITDYSTQAGCLRGLTVSLTMG